MDIYCALLTFSKQHTYTQTRTHTYIHIPIHTITLTPTHTYARAHMFTLLIIRLRNTHLTRDRVITSPHTDI